MEAGAAVAELLVLFDVKIGSSFRNSGELISSRMDPPRISLSPRSCMSGMSSGGGGGLFPCQGITSAAKAEGRRGKSFGRIVRPSVDPCITEAETVDKLEFEVCGINTGDAGVKVDLTTANSSENKSYKIPHNYHKKVPLFF